MFIFASCDNEASELPELPNLEQLNCFSFTSTEIELIGETHNKYLEEVYQSIDFTACIDCRSAIIASFKNIDVDISGLGISLDSLVNLAVDIYDRFESIDLRDWTNPPYSQKVHNYLSTILDAVDQSTSFGSFNIELQGIREIVSNDSTLNCLELDIILGSLEVAEKSAFIWMPQSMGGIGLQSFDNSNIESRRWSWRNAILGDVASVAADMVALSVVLAVTTAVPPANLALAIGIGVTAAVGSAFAGIM